MSTAVTQAISPTMGAEAQARKFFFALYRGGAMRGEWYELRCLDCRRKPARPGPRLYVRSITELVSKALQLRNDWDVFFGVGIRRCPDVLQMSACPHKQRGLDHVARLPAMWVDVDVQSADEPTKRYASIDQALDALHALDPQPELIVQSGTGLHAYWPFPEPRTDVERIAAVNQRIAKRVGGDNAWDVPRILRVPGTFNHKHGTPLPVRLLEGPADD